MASASDDGSIHVFHATVYSDLLRNPLVVPLKILRGHEVGEELNYSSSAMAQCSADRAGRDREIIGGEDACSTSVPCLPRESRMDFVSDASRGSEVRCL